MEKRTKEVSYKSTITACYIGNFIQAIVVNLTPILFIPLKEQFGLSFNQLGLLVLVNFVTQVSCDILFSGFLDKYGFRKFAILSHIPVIFGFLLFALTPALLPGNEYYGFLVATVLFSGSGGLLELLLSPIVNAIPTDEKASAMSMLHSFYSWGQVAVVLVTTLLLFVAGRGMWQWIVLMWTVFPILNLILFTKVPFGPQVPEEQRQKLGSLLATPFFIVCLLTILSGGAAELGISQWTSAFMERGMMLDKTWGDILGVCSFALMMGVGRLLYGIYGKYIKTGHVMAIGSLLAFVCYLTVGFSNSNVLSLAACALCGLAVSLLWPGTLVVAAEKFPLASASMFAILAAAGDIGASVGPYFMGLITDNAAHLPALANMAAHVGLSGEQLGLRSAMIVTAAFPLLCFVCCLWLNRRTKRKAKAAPAAGDPIEAKQSEDPMQGI